MFKTVAVSLAIVVGTLFSSALAQTSLDTEQLDAVVEQLMDAYDIPGVGLAVVEKGEVSYVQGYGVRDLATGVAVTPDTQFAIGSATKSFTSLGVMLLVEEGVLDLDTPVVTYLPEFKLSDPEATQTVTLRHILSHTSGLVRTDASSFDPSVSSAEVIAAAAETPLVGKPGEQFVYSNVNTIIAGEIIERVTGESWAAFTRERILEPLGMTTTTLSIEELKAQPDFALAYQYNVLEGLEPVDFLTLGADAPAGAINSSAREMAAYLCFQLGDGSPLLSTENLQEMHKRQIATPDFSMSEIIAAQATALSEQPEGVPASLTTDNGYGFYWGVGRFQGHEMVEHGGNVIGETANVTLLPEQRSGVVVLANADSANTFVEALRLYVANLLVGGAPDFDSSAVLQAQLEVLGDDLSSRDAVRQAARTYEATQEELTALEGTYESLADPNPTRVQVNEDGTLSLTSGFQEVRFEVDLLPIGENRFVANAQPLTGAVFDFNTSEGKTVIALESPFGAMPLAKRSE